MSFVTLPTDGTGKSVACNPITRDAITEQMQLANVADPVTGASQGVAAAGAAATNAAFVQGVSVIQTLATAVAATGNQAWTSTTFGSPRGMTVALSASAATTFTITGSMDGTTFFALTLPGVQTTANWSPVGVGTLAFQITAVPYVKVATLNAVTVTAILYATY